MGINSFAAKKENQNISVEYNTEFGHVSHLHSYNLQNLRFKVEVPEIQWGSMIEYNKV